MFVLLGFSGLFRKAKACGQLSEAVARLAEIMHYDPKIDHSSKKAHHRNNALLSIYLMLSAVVCTCAYPRAWQCFMHVDGSLCALERHLHFTC